MFGARKRLDSLKKFLAQLHENLALEFGFVLWDGSWVPEGFAPDRVAIAIADEGAVAALIRRPNADTLANLWVSGRIDIKNGTIFDLMALRPKTPTRKFWTKVGWGKALDVGLKYLFVPRGEPWPLKGMLDKPNRGNVEENKSNIGYHYDLSNAFYALWLDPEMIYTCAYFRNLEEDLATAQLNKLEMTCRRLRLKPTDSVLDLGCGWGAFSCYAAQNYGVRCYGVTLSEPQVAYAREKVKRLGLEDRVTIELKDYSAVEGSYNKIVALGLLDHVGIDNHAIYYETIKRLLAPRGLFLNQAITRRAKRDEKAFRKKRPEFAALTKYIFPGGELDHIGRTVTSLERHGFEVHEIEDWREHYQRTCRLWHDRLLARHDEAVREVGMVATRLWLAYLAASSIAFQRNTACVYQTLASRRWQGPSGLPLTRDDLYR